MQSIFIFVEGAAAVKFESRLNWMIDATFIIIWFKTLKFEVPKCNYSS